ncbi:hypothetical protein TNIN_330031 [Trichonephila inaurata madagascariensis]|uniref:Uncharacterized protein n=1 Tax=Trichonephila inaurata madagascariensis TaxID=2747483 RepID=A0A8X6YXS7_9ARAC|nr:hypothetical protein TNIN_330031 [Trichonephila inaurata madagascariensis]
MKRLKVLEVLVKPHEDGLIDSLSEEGVLKFLSTEKSETITCLMEEKGSDDEVKEEIDQHIEMFLDHMKTRAGKDEESSRNEETDYLMDIDLLCNPNPQKR